MVSSLANQLQRLREGGAGSKQKSTSFLYSESEAGNIDNEMIYNRACNGLMELQQMDVKFESFDPSNHDGSIIFNLFSRDKIHFHRAHCTQEENIELNTKLQQLFNALSGYFLLSPCHKVLEYLVRRYEIHRNNVDDLISAFLCYHESSWFARLVGILHIKDTRWEFLLGMKKQQQYEQQNQDKNAELAEWYPLQRSALVQRLKIDPRMPQFLFSTAIQLGKSNSKCISLYTLVVMEYLESGPASIVLDETCQRWIIPHILESFETAKKEDIVELQSSAAMILTKLVSKQQLSASVIDTLIKQLVVCGISTSSTGKHQEAHPSLQWNSLLCIIFVAQTQSACTRLSSSVGKFLLSTDNLFDLLLDASHSYDTTSFFKLLFGYILKKLTRSASNEFKYSSQLMELIRSMPHTIVNSSFYGDLIKRLILQARRLQYKSNIPEVSIIQRTLMCCSHRDVLQTDKAVHTLLREIKADAIGDDIKSENHKLQAFLNSTFAEAVKSEFFVPKTTDSSTSILLALDYPNEELRYQAIVQLETNLDILSDGDVLLRRLMDDSARIVQYIVKSDHLKGALFSLLPMEDVYDTISDALYKWETLHQSNSSKKSKKKAKLVVDTILQSLILSEAVKTTKEIQEKLFPTLLSLVQIDCKTLKASADNGEDNKTILTSILALKNHPVSQALQKTIDNHVLETDDVVLSLGRTLADHVLTILPHWISWCEVHQNLSNSSLRLSLLAISQATLGVVMEEKLQKSAAKSLAEESLLLDSFSSLVFNEFQLQCRSLDFSKTVINPVCVAELLTQVTIACATSSSSFSLLDCLAAFFQAPTEIFSIIQHCLVTLMQSRAFEAVFISQLIHLAINHKVSDNSTEQRMKCRALEILSAIVDNTQIINHDGVQVVIVLLVSLMESSKAIRVTAVECLQRWIHINRDFNSFTNDQAIIAMGVAYFLRGRTDIQMDANAVYTLCSDFTLTVETNDEIRNQRKFAPFDFHKLLLSLSCANIAQNPMLAVRLLTLLKHVKSTQLWLESIDYFYQTLRSTKNQQHLDEFLAILMHQYLDLANAPKSKKSGQQECQVLIAKPFVEVLISSIDQQLKKSRSSCILINCILDSMDAEVYKAISDDLQTSFSQLLVNFYLQNKDEKLNAKLQSCLRTLPLQFNVFVNILDAEFHQNTDRNTSDQQRQRLVSIMELMGSHINSERSVVEQLGCVNLLISVGKLLSWWCSKIHHKELADEEKYSDDNYLLQLIFGILRDICHILYQYNQYISSDLKHISCASNIKGNFSADQLVHDTLGCLNHHLTQATRNEGLLFIAALVNISPTTVIRSLKDLLQLCVSKEKKKMAVDKAIHADIGKHDYSFQVILTIVQAVGPHIQNSTEPQIAGNSILNKQHFIEMFVEVFHQLPRKQREGLFVAVIHSLGESHALPYVIVALIQHHVLSQEKVQSKLANNLEDDLETFVHQLCLQFNVASQLNACVEVMRNILRLFPYVLEDADTDTDDVEDQESYAAAGIDESTTVVDAKQQWKPFEFAKGLESTESSREVNLHLLRFLPTQMKSKAFHHQIFQHYQTAHNADDFQNLYLRLAQLVLEYFGTVTRAQSLREETNTNKASPSSDSDDAELYNVQGGSFWKIVVDGTVEILDALQQLLSTPGFVAVISELLQHESNLVRKKALQLFNSRLDEDHSSLTVGEELLYVEMLDDLQKMLNKQPEVARTTDTAWITVQTALLSVDILARHFSGKYPSKFKSILPTLLKYVELDIPLTSKPKVAEYIHTGHGLHVVGCSYVALSSICDSLGAVVFPYLPKFFPKLLKMITFCAGGLTGKRQATVLQCLLASLEIFTNKIPQFLVPYLSEIFHTLFTPEILSSGSTQVASDNSNVLQSIDICLGNLASNTELRLLLPNLFGELENIIGVVLLASTSAASSSLNKYFTTVSSVISQLSSGDTKQNFINIVQFYINALDIRRRIANVTTPSIDVEAAENSVLNSLMTFILKLSEKQLKPLFLKMADWAAIKTNAITKHDSKNLRIQGNLSRRITFFRVVSLLSNKLRGIFVPYYGHILDFIVHTLNDAHSTLTMKPPHIENQSINGSDNENSDNSDDDQFFIANKSTKKQKTMEGSVDKVHISEQLSMRSQQFRVLECVIQALDSCFAHDQDGFVDKAIFDRLMSPLVNILDIVRYDSGTTKPFVFNQVAKCLAHFAGAAKQDLLWKPFHYAVLMKSRDDKSANVRLATLYTIEQCYQLIGDEFLTMLPESIPFLAELMEDTNREVEQLCHKVIRHIEEISGESLDQYLTT